jgi:ATP-dependent Lon protease
MTGEMTLAGQVLPVGGLKEKILAAHRAGIKKIIAPAACRPDIEHNVPDSVKEGINIVYVENVAQVRSTLARSAIFSLTFLLPLPRLSRRLSKDTLLSRSLVG